ncbi:matrix metalloproteinase-21-like isoform X2 [Xenopus laevis]|uniref:Matrix metalloproteinase-21-like isoform X2 n=1 Tax=Xenopus laevis TaxID=8355 RepID=A0A8J1M0H5_XENLA|nr:matrix metalloproteinase-21-like isoform X2 [Xenopus laevis]XP_041435243.1 matrix metalloproteinase-21-like isoform X2 [Xenopus laevis]
MIRALDFLSIFFLLFPIIFAERSFYPRDSAERQSKTEVQVRPIVTPRSAQRYLWKYGWIEPVHWESRLFHGDPTPTVENVIQSDSSDLLSVKNTPFDSESLTDKELTLNPRFSGALRRFQEANELVVTGKLDAATMMAMNVLRCGVPDRKVPEGEESQPEDSEENGSTTPSIPNESEEDNRDPHEESTEEIQETGQTLGLPAKHHIRRKRSQLLKAGAKRTAFAKHTLKWRLLGEGYSAWLSKEQQRYILRLAFRMWSEVVPLNFEEDLFFPAHLIDVKLGFGTRRHLGCSQLFDDMGREFAHAWQLGDIHFNDDEHFVPPNSEHGISLLKVAVHEIGHVLGLSHMNLLGSVMQPNYIPANGKMELDWTDRMAIQKIYGKCLGRFNTVFDWVYQEPDDLGHKVSHYNTYFFRRSWYWRYENSSNRTWYGYPQELKVGWEGIPHADIDAFLHFWTRKKRFTLFFKGKLYWRYDDQNDRAYRQDPEGHIYPRLISEGFPGISGPIDTVFFDQRDHNIYFFHKKNVTAFGVESQKVVPGYPKAIEDLFPAAKSGDHPKGNLDAVYFSFSHKAIFFIKGSYVWSVATSADLPYNSLLPRRLINEQWNDICDVHPSMLSMPRR